METELAEDVNSFIGERRAEMKMTAIKSELSYNQAVEKVYSQLKQELEVDQESRFVRAHNFGQGENTSYSGAGE